MLFVESGRGKPRAWARHPMQMGNPGDPGPPTLTEQRESDKRRLIMPADFRAHLSVASVLSSPRMNIIAGVGYLLLRAAHFKFGVHILDKTIMHVKVQPGDSFSRIANRVGSVESLIRQMNLSISPINLKIGTVLAYQKAKQGWMITGWRTLDGNEIKTLYNGHGDPEYAKRFDYALSFIKHRKLPAWLPPHPPK